MPFLSIVVGAKPHIIYVTGWDFAITTWLSLVCGVCVCVCVCVCVAIFRDMCVCVCMNRCRYLYYYYYYFIYQSIPAPFLAPPAPFLVCVSLPLLEVSVTSSFVDRQLCAMKAPQPIKVDGHRALLFLNSIIIFCGCTRVPPSPAITACLYTAWLTRK